MKINKKINKAICLSLIFINALTNINVYALTKNETVYTILNADGSIKKTTINEHLINDEKLDTIYDYTDLNNIVNINGNETYKLEDKKLTWQAYGNDIFYKGTYEDELPVDIKITYYKDDKEVSYKDILGDNGNIKIVIKYENKDSHNVYVNGKNETLYTPFVVTSSMTLSSDKDKNVSVTNGKVISLGTKEEVVAVMAPGLYESLDIDSLKALDETVIEYETTNFSLPTMYFFVTPKLISSSDINALDNIDDLYDKANLLQSNMDKINEGANSLKEGSNKLKDTLKEKVTTISNTDNTLSSEDVDKIKEAVLEGVNNKYTDEYKKAIGDMAYQEVLDSISSDDTISKALQDSIEEYIQNTLKEYFYEQAKICQMAKLKEEEMTEDETLSCMMYQSDKVKQDMGNMLGEVSLKTLNTSNDLVLPNIVKKVAIEASSKTAKETALNVAEEVSQTVSKNIFQGTKQELTKSLNELLSGVTSIDDGVNNLQSGITKFNEEGIRNLTNIVNNDLKQNTSKIEKLVSLGEEYKTVNNESIESEDEVKFIYVIKGEENKTDVKIDNNVTNKTTLWERIKNIF